MLTPDFALAHPVLQALAEPFSLAEPLSLADASSSKRPAALFSSLQARILA